MAQGKPGRSRGRPRQTLDPQPGQTVQALDRGLSLFAQVARYPASTLTEIAASAAMAPSTAYRMLETLRGHGLVVFAEDEQTWSIGVEAFRIGRAFAQRINYLEAGRQQMRWLTETTGETSNIAIADGGDVVFVSQIETAEPIRAFFPPGTRSSMHASGIGKALLACLSDSAALEIADAARYAEFTPHTIRDADRLRAELDRIRARGWSIDDEEHYLGMRCIAAPIFDEHGNAIAGVSISGPTARLADAKLAELGPLLRAAADRITASIGGLLPDTPPG